MALRHKFFFPTLSRVYDVETQVFEWHGRIPPLLFVQRASIFLSNKRFLARGSSDSAGWILVIIL